MCKRQISPFKLHNLSIPLVRQDYTAIHDSLCDAESCPAIYIWHTVALFHRASDRASCLFRLQIHNTLPTTTPEHRVCYNELLIEISE